MVVGLPLFFAEGINGGKELFLFRANERGARTVSDVQPWPEQTEVSSIVL
jgi:hypothetical protein